jgi:hypothetical protein
MEIYLIVIYLIVYLLLVLHCFLKKKEIRNRYYNRLHNFYTKYIIF